LWKTCIIFIHYRILSIIDYFTLGKLKIRTIRAESFARHRDATLLEFHDALLRPCFREHFLGPGAGPAL